MQGNQPHPLAIGGVGGSGTRVAAILLTLLGYYLGDDLNESLDNLWFTLLFKRRSVLVESDRCFNSLAGLFFSRMSGDTDVSEAPRARLRRLAGQDRLQHDSVWLLERVSTFCDRRTAYCPGQAWGWKEPNTHIVIDRLLKLDPALKYIHITRHPLEMALSSNQNQLQFWGPVFLDGLAGDGPRNYLAYWCAAHRRITEVKRAWPQRVMLLDIAGAWANPELFCREIAGFAGAGMPGDLLSGFASLVHPPASAGRHRGVALDQFEPEDLAYVARLGYDLPAAK